MGELECPVRQWPLCTRLEISISVMPALKAYPILLISFVKWFSFTFFQEKISENTLPERIAIEEAKRLDEEAKRLERLAIEEANRLCLTQYIGYYKILDNQCFYFEANRFNFDSANKNCQEKLRASARLYEPKSVSKMK